MNSVEGRKAHESCFVVGEGVIVSVLWFGDEGKYLQTLGLPLVYDCFPLNMFAKTLLHNFLKIKMKSPCLGFGNFSPLHHPYADGSEDALTTARPTCEGVRAHSVVLLHP